jgi:pimeloyl-ACP methyl ester carboxylesterase
MELSNQTARRGPVIPSIIGMILIAAGAADAHDLVTSARDADWRLLTRADLEILGGFWLLSGRFPAAARISALAAGLALSASDLIRTAAHQSPRPLFGRVVVGSGWILSFDGLILAGLVGWWLASRVAAPSPRSPARTATALLVAVGVGLAIDRSQVGQFPIVATVRAGRTSSGLDYLVYPPRGYHRSSRRWPLILTLHGRGEAGNDLEILRRQGLCRVTEARGGVSFIVVAPQSPDWTWSVEALALVLDEVIRRYRVDTGRIYLAGNSMGGNGTWELAARHPERFAAIIPICGRGDPAWAARLRDVPTWAFHGAEDRIVPPSVSEQMVAAVKEAGGDARLTLYPGVGHDAWTPAYSDPELYRWLLQHRRRSSAHDSSAGP